MRNVRRSVRRIAALPIMIGFVLVVSWQLSQKNDKDTLYQVSVMNALLQGSFDPAVDIKTLKKHGDFGIGTFEALDGEMVVLAGNVYQARSDGSVHVALDTVKSPFAMVTFFDASERAVLDKPFDLEDMKKFIDNFLPAKNIMYAVKIEGRFDRVKTRSVPRQEKPYRTLAEAVKEQSVFELSAVEGVIVGFIIPSYMKGVHPAGYHLHFLSADRKLGGHLLDCKINRGVVSIDDMYQYQIVLPKDNQFLRLDLSAGDASVEK